MGGFEIQMSFINYWSISAVFAVMLAAVIVSPQQILLFLLGLMTNCLVTFESFQLNQ